MRTHEQMADSRLKFALRLNEMSEELSNLVKEVDKNRKVVSIPIDRCPSPVVPASHLNLPSCKTDERAGHSL